MFDITIIGAAIIDTLVRPIEIENIKIPTHPTDCIRMGIGGDAANEATILGKLGKKVNLLTKLGSDTAGSMIKAHFDSVGVSLEDACVVDDIDTGINVVLVRNNGERSFITNQQGTLRKFYPEDIHLEALKKAPIMCLASIFVSSYLTPAEMKKIFMTAKSYGCTVCSDVKTPKNGATLETIREILPYVDYLFPNYFEASVLTGLTDLDEMADAFLACGLGCIIIKTGADGCYVKTKNEAFHSPGYRVEHCVDTTGAGDNFAAGFLYALSEGMSLKDCAAFANATASLSVESIGAQSGVIDILQVMRRFSLSK